MLWKKLGWIYVAAGEQEWAASHAYIPTAYMPDSDRIRIYTSFLDREKIGRVGFVDLAVDNPLQILRISETPALNIGLPGTFDDSGVSPTCVIADDDNIYLYYFGWQRGVHARYYLFTGLAISEDGGTHFRRLSQTPILDRSDEGLFVRSAGFVLFDQQLWKMWYVAGAGWVDVKGKQVPTYNIRYLESSDKTRWGKSGTVCIDFANEDEFGFGRPFVTREQGIFRMWYSIRTVSNGYRLGYAESEDGKTWLRKDSEVGIDVSQSGWDSDMICFGCIQKTKYGTYMFYNGNNYGETGFGVAVLEP